MKYKFINILAIIFQFVDAVLCKLHIKHPKVIVYMDGGICSQMMMYIHGMYYAKHGFDVLYDDLWFKRCGKDQFGQMDRKLELTEMWPNLNFKTPSKWQRKWYLLFFKAPRIDGDWLPNAAQIKRSFYLNGYWNIPIQVLQEIFPELYDMTNASVPEKYRQCSYDNVVGVHVRRGDLAKGDNPVYGGVTDRYFLNAIDFCTQRFAPNKYIFFSDEPEWVEKNICKHLEQSYEIMRNNKAWEDLWLLAQCPIIVASQGSFGKVSARLNPQSILIQCDNKYAWRERENTYFIQ